jgi:hypothetical protein
VTDRRKPYPPPMRVIRDGGWLTKFTTAPQVQTKGDPMTERKRQPGRFGWQFRMLLASFILRALLWVWPSKSANVVCAIAVLNIELMTAEP